MTNEDIHGELNRLIKELQDINRWAILEVSKLKDIADRHEITIGLMLEMLDMKITGEMPKISISRKGYNEGVN